RVAQLVGLAGEPAGAGHGVDLAPNLRAQLLRLGQLTDPASRLLSLSRRLQQRQQRANGAAVTVEDRLLMKPAVIGAGTYHGQLLQRRNRFIEPGGEPWPSPQRLSGLDKHC